MTSNKITDETIIEEKQEENPAVVPKKKKKKKRTIDKAKVAENKKKAKAKKMRQKERLKEEKARIKAEKKKGKVLEETVKMEETVTVNEKGAVEHAITIEETYVIEENKAPQKEPKKRKRTFLIAGIAAALLLLAGAGSYLGIERYLREQEIAEYYGRIGMANKAGDAAISYRDYWEDLIVMAEGDIAGVDNITTALMVYKELVYQIYNRASLFRSAGVERQELLDELEAVGQLLETKLLIPEDGNQERNRLLMEELLSDLERAKRQVDAAFLVWEEA